MLDITLLGTSGMMPLPNRHLTSLIIKYNGYGILIDCGEGTQVVMQKKELSPKQIDYILLTHLHADHTSGLPGLLLRMVNAGRIEDVTIIGPEGTEKLINAVKIITLGVKFKMKVVELRTNNKQIKIDNIKGEVININAFKVKHSITCYGYTINLTRKGKFNLENAEKLNIDKNYWKILQSGFEVIINNKIYTPEMVMGAERKGLKITYCTDTRPTNEIIENAKNSDILILEGMYGNDKEKAKEKKHMTMKEAAEIAKKSKAKELWLTHFSPSEIHPEIYKEEISTIFKNTKINNKGYHKELKYMEE